MKDFQEFLNNNDKANTQSLINKPVPTPKEPGAYYKDIITKALPYLSPFLLSIVTGPFTTLSVLLQVTNKGIGSGL
jgi:hypothetical protein